LDYGTLTMVLESIFMDMVVCGIGDLHGMPGTCRCYRVHGMTHVFALDAWSYKLNGNIFVIVCLVIGLLGS
jgi:hypothetical protein